MRKNQYVLLTGGKNNAGDHLIKLRAKKLFEWLKPNVKILDLDGWKKLDDSILNEINNSKALIMTGGPALQNKMYPRVYGLRENLEDIKVPMITMGIGWYSQKGEWANTHNYKLDNASLKLLEKIDKSGYFSSVRDYHTLNVLNALGLKHFLMTGCPALYEKEFIEDKEISKKTIKRIGYSLGVSMKTSNRMYKQMQNVLLELKKIFPNTEIDVVFHHSPSDIYLQTEGSSFPLYQAQKKYLKWLQENKFNYIDISGNAENLINYYNNVDLHIGYRVHAHIFMSSISKPSVLLNEDGRGKALEKVLGGVILNAYNSVNDSFLFKALHKLSLKIDNYKVNNFFEKDLINTIEYEMKNGIKFSQPRVEINRHFKIMERFISQLP